MALSDAERKVSEYIEKENKKYYPMTGPATRYKIAKALAVRLQEQVDVLMPQFCFECEEPGKCASAETCYGHHEGYPRRYPSKSGGVVKNRNTRENAAFWDHVEKVSARVEVRKQISEWDKSATTSPEARAATILQSLPADVREDVYDMIATYVENLNDRIDALRTELVAMGLGHGEKA